MLLKKKPLSDEKINFNPKSAITVAKADKEDAKDKKSKGKSKSKFWAKKAAATLAKGE